MAKNSGHSIDIAVLRTRIPEQSISPPPTYCTYRPFALSIQRSTLSVERLPPRIAALLLSRQLQRPLNVDFVEEPPVVAPALWICSAVSEADSCLLALCGEEGHREGDKLRQFSQILGGGG